MAAVRLAAFLLGLLAGFLVLAGLLGSGGLCSGAGFGITDGFLLCLGGCAATNTTATNADNATVATSGDAFVTASYKTLATAGITYQAVMQSAPASASPAEVEPVPASSPAPVQAPDAPAAPSQPSAASGATSAATTPERLRA